LSDGDISTISTVDIVLGVSVRLLVGLSSMKCIRGDVLYPSGVGSVIIILISLPLAGISRWEIFDEE
jgi:hypothetical protein